MQATEFPDWAPRSLCDLYAREMGTPCSLKQSELSLLKSLLTLAVMQGVWENLRELENGKQFFSVAERFASAVILAYRGPEGEEKFTPARQAKKLNAVKLTAIQLSKLVKGTLWDDWLEKKWAAYGLPQVDRAGVKKMPGKLSEFLEEFAIFAAGQVRWSVLGRPTASDAQELYFKRTLAAYCFSEFGSRYESIVNTVAFVIYPKSSRECTIDEAEKDTVRQIEATPSRADNEEVRGILDDFPKLKTPPT